MCIYYYNKFNSNTVDEESYFILKQIFESIDNNNLSNAQNLTKKLIDIEKEKGNNDTTFLEDALKTLR
ncbi:hypothetical protein C672_1772 [[Clostridium] bifermentans ATCC 638]|uniref:Uncharacterized protein n=1 Tax=Paraclostridium bifermentans ATCC 638 = DSM 14991 TaxID=1233171 RepID=T4VMV9_PARBF|nr:hypothetical protein [Paraclostridium bifermentans]EQK42828.1 hypothetical protein C672_1772 [[Clostridium] bifermentans ATCC 638] [Paraclostridium bifermentans ATCC 638 = DSM 14991]RIZ57585.1 hypothetical protein CHH45_15660 [Paraclostridium bifermentans]UAG16716.1 hypothetical protein KXZ80_07905 [Paraclostridium bifermentans]